MLLIPLLIVSVTGVLGASYPDIDINRVELLHHDSKINSLHKPQNRRSIELKRSPVIRSNDYDDHSGWYHQSHAPLHNLHDAYSSSKSKRPIKIHKPREDPRFYYQSDEYLKKIGGKDVKEVSFIYPGEEVVRAGEKKSHKIYDKEFYKLSKYTDSKMCVKCPHDRTLIAKASLGRVILKKPPLETCSGLKSPRDVTLVHMYGPKFGSLLGQGSHMFIGRIMYQGKTLQMCKMQVHVVLQGCATPNHLLSNCWDHNRRCNFTCKDTHFELYGPTTLTCSEDLRWEGVLPVCKATTWCKAPPPPDHGHVSCQGATAMNGAGLVEGSKCRVRCARGWRWSPRGAAVCRRGAWTQALRCQPKRTVYNNKSHNNSLK